MSVLDFILIAVEAYLLGSLNAAIVVSKLLRGYDIRDKGSGNAGLTNSLRTMGAKCTVLVLLGDVGKGVVAALVGGYLAGPLGKLVSGIFVMLGHMFPLYFGFRGGKGALVGVTMLFVFDWRVFCIAMAVFTVVVVLTRYVSLGSMLGAASFPFSTWFLYHDPLYVALAALMAAGLIFMHRGNISRLIAGTERRLSFRGKKEEDK